MTEHDGPFRQTYNSCRFHIFLVFLSHDRGSDGSCEHGPVGQADDNGQQGNGQPLKTAQSEHHLKNGRQENGHHQIRKGELDIGKTHENGIGFSSHIPR